jgi:hypothetical protein
MFNIKNSRYRFSFLFLFIISPFLFFVIFSCSKSEATAVITPGETIIEVNPSLFIESSLIEPIVKVNKTLSNGTTAECYKITMKNTPTDHTMGPWCPTNISDGADKGGLWFEKGKIYDVDGAFVKNMATFYSDAKWKLYKDDGTINVTSTKEACMAAARPDVDPKYKNYCVECLPTYFQGIKTSYYIPVKPIKLSSSSTFSMGMGAIVGLAFNGVGFDPPAPTQAILGAYTLAPLDDAGGHVNGVVGYHYHAATGKSKKVTQTDGHAAMIGYVIDGFGLYELLDQNGKEPVGLDNCRGHYDTTRGYHYHVASAGSNSFIPCFSGAKGTFEVTQ